MIRLLIAWAAVAIFKFTAQANDGLVPPPPAPPADAPAAKAGPPTSGASTLAPQMPSASSVPPMAIPMLPVPSAQPAPTLSPVPSNLPGLQVPADSGPNAVALEGPSFGMPTAMQPYGAPASGVSRLRTSPARPPEIPGIEQEVLPPQPSLVFRTRDVVRPDAMRGKFYRLAEYAPLVDYRFQFELETPWGTIPAHGMALLDLRLRELCALEYGSRIARKNPMFVEGAVRAALATPEGAFIWVTDPVDSLRRTALGLKRVVQAKCSPGGKRANCESRRRIACLIGCDPETRNPPLQCLLDSMSTNACAGWLTVDAVLNIPVPGLGAAAVNAEFKRMMTVRSTREIESQLDASLLQLGLAEELRARFLCNENYTTSERMVFVYYLRKLVGIENIGSLVEGAADAADESEAVSAIQEVQLLTQLRRTRPITRVSFAGLPTVRLDDGSQLIVSAADYLVDSPPLAELISRYRSESPSVPTTLVTLGRVSPDAERQFEQAGIRIAHQSLAKHDEETNSKEGNVDRKGLAAK